MGGYIRITTIEICVCDHTRILNMRTVHDLARLHCLVCYSTLQILQVTAVQKGIFIGLSEIVWVVNVVRIIPAILNFLACLFGDYFRLDQTHVNITRSALSLLLLLFILLLNKGGRNALMHLALLLKRRELTASHIECIRRALVLRLIHTLPDVYTLYGFLDVIHGVPGYLISMTLVALATLAAVALLAVVDDVILIGVLRLLFGTLVPHCILLNI